MATKTSAGDDRLAADEERTQAKVRWNTPNLKNSFANFCNATNSRAEAILDFGVSNKWERTPQDMEIKLALRIACCRRSTRSASRASSAS